MKKRQSARGLTMKCSLSIHTGREIWLALTGWPHLPIQLILRYAFWLNLIEPWWQQRRSLTLKGCRFETVDELAKTLNAALDCWNAHRHSYRRKKRYHVQVTLLGGFGFSPIAHTSQK